MNSCKDTYELLSTRANKSVGKLGAGMLPNYLEMFMLVDHQPNKGISISQGNGPDYDERWGCHYRTRQNMSGTLQTHSW